MELEPCSSQEAQSCAPNATSDPPNTLPKLAGNPANKNQDLTTPVASEKLRDITDAVLNFLSNASNETLGACAIGLCATTYLVLGQVGLVLIGAAGGIVLHATWEASNNTTGGGQNNAADGSRRRKELGIEVVRRALDWRVTSKDAREGEVLKTGTVEGLPDDKILGYSDFRPATRTALTALTDAVIRDYVRQVYSDFGLHSR
jgi:hypothetical protein